MERDTENGLLIGPDGCHYKDEWEALWIGRLGMCGCGNPEEGYNFVRSVLATCDARNKERFASSAQDEIAKMIAENADTAAHVLLHFLTDKKVLEHGSSVGGSWLTPDGQEIVDGAPAPFATQDQGRSNEG